MEAHSHSAPTGKSEMGGFRFDLELCHSMVLERSPTMKKFDPKIIPYLAAITTSIMLTRAAVDHFGAWWGWPIGLMAGLVTSFSLAVAGSRISDIASKRKPLAYVALLGMVVISPIVIALSDPTPDTATWAWALFPDVSILLASTVTGKSLLASNDPAQPAKPKAKVFAAPAFSCAKCAFIATSQKALNGHQRKHRIGVTP